VLARPRLSRASERVRVRAEVEEVSGVRWVALPLAPRHGLCLVALHLFFPLSLSLGRAGGGPLQWDVRDGAGRWACSVLLLVQRSRGGELRLF
jgi:hypothetical protein